MVALLGCFVLWGHGPGPLAVKLLDAVRDHAESLISRSCDGTSRIRPMHCAVNDVRQLVKEIKERWEASTD